MFCDSALPFDIIRLSAASDDGLMICRVDGVGVGSRMVVDGARGRDEERLRVLCEGEENKWG